MALFEPRRENWFFRTLRAVVTFSERQAIDLRRYSVVYRSCIKGGLPSFAVHDFLKHIQEHTGSMTETIARKVILLANSRQAACAISVRNFERLVVASSAPLSHSVILTRSIAAAVATCWRWVLA